MTGMSPHAVHVARILLMIYAVVVVAGLLHEFWPWDWKGRRRAIKLHERDKDGWS